MTNDVPVRFDRRPAVSEEELLVGYGVPSRVARALTVGHGMDAARPALDVPTVERVLRRYFQAVDATGRSRSWWRLRAQEVSAALSDTQQESGS